MTVQILDGLHVSRETFDRLKQFEALVLKWQKTINLVSRDSISDLWDRHIIDSAQLFRIELGSPDRLVDIGSGGGMPGIIAAIILTEQSPMTKITLMESDQRKSTFLRTALRECGVSGEVISSRIEVVAPQNASILTARALAETSQLLGHAHRHLSPSGVAILHKGRKYREEVDRARQEWQFDCKIHPSLTDPDACLLEIRNITRADP